MVFWPQDIAFQFVARIGGFTLPLKKFPIDGGTVPNADFGSAFARKLRRDKFWNGEFPLWLRLKKPKQTLTQTRF